MNGGSLRTKEIAQVCSLFNLVVISPLQDLGRSYHAHVANLLHIQDGILRHAEVVDEVRCSLGVLGIDRYAPAVKPYVGTLVRNNIIQCNAYFFGLVNRPLGIARPRQIHPGLALGHLFLTEIHFPAGYVILGFQQNLLYAVHTFSGQRAHQLIARHFAARNLIAISILYQYGIYIAEGIFHEDMSLELRVQNGSPAAQIISGYIRRVIKPTRRAPHVAYRIVLYVDAPSGRSHLLELLLSKGRYQLGVVGCLTVVLVNRLQQVLAQHTLDDILRRADYVVVLVSNLYLGQHRLVDIKGLVDNVHIFAGLLFVPSGELVQHILQVDIVGPVIDFQGVFAVGSKGCHSHDYGHQAKNDFFHFFICLFVRIFMMINSTKMVRKMSENRGLNSGVKPPLRASA